jgi:hypothetical protein
MMRSRRTIVILITAWIVALFAAGAIWRSFHPAKSDSGPSEDRLVASRQDGYYACLHLPATSVVRLDLAARARFIARKLPQDDQPSALNGCDEAIRR